MSTKRKSALRKLWEKIGEPIEATNHLHDTRIFRAAVYGPVITALLVATAGYLRSPVEPEWTLTGFNNFVALFKLPIGIAGVAIPLAALVASHHRSIQTASQIISQQAQNTFSNYVKHKEYFSKFLDEEGLLDGRSSFKAVNKKVYDILFPFAAEGDLRPAPRLTDYDIDLVIELVGDTVHIARKIDWSNQENIGKLWDIVDRLRREIQELFSLEAINSNLEINVENILHEINRIRITLKHLSSALSFLEPYADDENLGIWSDELLKATYPLKDVRNFELAEEKLKDTANSGARVGLVTLNTSQINQLKDLLGDNLQIKKRFLEKKHENNRRMLEAIRHL